MEWFVCKIMATNIIHLKNAHSVEIWFVYACQWHFIVLPLGYRKLDFALHADKAKCLSPLILALDLFFLWFWNILIYGQVPIFK